MSNDNRRIQIYEFMSCEPDLPVTSTDIAIEIYGDAYHMKRASNVLRYMSNEGILTRVGRGVYVINPDSCCPCCGEMRISRQKYVCGTRQKRAQNGRPGPLIHSVDCLKERIRQLELEKRNREEVGNE